MSTRGNRYELHGERGLRLHAMFLWYAFVNINGPVAVRDFGDEFLPDKWTMNILPEDLTRLHLCIEASVGPASTEENTTLTGWAVFETRLAHTPDVLSRHLVGYAEEAQQGRASSAVAELDVASRTARTSSGRLYRLRGEPGPGADARHVWGRFLRVNAAADVRDVTDELFPDVVPMLGTPKAADIEFEPQKAVFLVGPMEVDLPGFTAEKVIGPMREALGDDLLSEEVDRGLRDEERGQKP